ncbi:MAG: GMC family oxidoreductase [Pseudomonadota bacterium]|nr:GMC family oxidoreductase [Pseudomonadota bacterium]
MIFDMNDIPDGELLSSDLCIVGAGAAGITLAMDLVDSGIDVLLLESGGMHREKNTQALYRGEVANLRLHSPPDRYRQRRFGGTTTIWGGRCIPFDPIDFEARDFMPNSGWPISYDDLSPLYPQANRICEAGDFAYTVSETFTRPLRPMIEGFPAVNFSTDTLERFSCPTDFGARYGKKLRAAADVRVILHANVTAVRLNAEGNHVDSVMVRSLAGRSATVRARHFVLAAGGLEVVRLLLASRDVQAEGIGNRHDIVGRYYMCHLAGTVGAVSINRPRDSVWHGYEVSDEGIYCRRRIALKPSAQHEYRVGNFITRLHHPRITDPDHRNSVLSLIYLAKILIPYEYRKRLHGEERASAAIWLKHLRNVLSGPFDAVGFAWHMLKNHKLANRKFPSIIIRPKANLYSLDFHAEQQPNAASRVTLGREADVLGMPQIRVDWRYTAVDLNTISRSLQLLAQEFGAGGLGELRYDPEALESEMTRYGAYGGHHIGTTRMGTDPRNSVVDANCRVHGVGNLHIASAAVFPTSSQANPTLTVVALSLRLAKRIKALILAC